MKNADKPASAFEEVVQYRAGIVDKYKVHTGLTKREQFCLQMGVPETGDPELDDITRKGERKRIAAMAMQTMISSKYVGDFATEINKSYSMPHGLANNAIRYADALLEELEK